MMIGALTVPAIGGAYLVGMAFVDWGTGFATVTAVTPMPAGSNLNKAGSSGSYAARVWAQFCAAGKSYTLLSLPVGASFTIGAGNTSAFSSRPSGIDACMQVGNLDGDEVVLCRGQGPSRFPMTVSSASVSQKYMLGLEGCSAAASATASPLQHATGTPTPKPGALPTNVPGTISTP